MDKLSKIMRRNKALMYKHRGDPTIGIGVLGMINDTIGISKCGIDSVVKNAVLNSFVEAHRLEMHKDKSMVTHIGSSNKCNQPCPKLQVHANIMPEAKQIKYLGNIITCKGGNRATIEDRRNKGWGKVSTIMGILGELELGAHKIMVGLLLTKAILTSSLLFSAELYRLEQVDLSLLKSLVRGIKKRPLFFII